MSTKCVLIVDDEEDIAEVARTSLEMIAGWRVLTASSGAEGLACAVAERPDAILLDMMMPSMDGPTTLAKLREQDVTRDIPVILLTAKVQGMDARDMERLGVRATITKPFHPVQLADRVAAVLGWAL